MFRPGWHRGRGEAAGSAGRGDRRPRWWAGQGLGWILLPAEPANWSERPPAGAARAGRRWL